MTGPRLNTPEPLAVTVPSTVAPRRTVTELPASAVPVRVCDAVLVIRSVAEPPVSELMPVKTGAAGAVVSMVTVAL